MKSDEDFYKVFLEHLHELENFRMSYAAIHPTTPLDREDPDVRRLTEAMAYFAARTHEAGIRNILKFRRRIFQQFFSFLLTPLPAMGMIRAKLTGQFTEPVLLPKGTEIAVSTETKGTAMFRLLYDTRILPISLTEMKMLLLPNKGYRLVLALSAPYARNDDIGYLRFHVNHLDDFQASVRALYSLKHHLSRATVVFDENVTEETRGTPCEVFFGVPPDVEEEEWPHPLQKERWFFHFPEGELYLTVHLRSQPRNWSRFAICIDLNSRWPRNLVLNQDMFQLFAVPIANLNPAIAQPIICEGTRERYAIRHPEPEYNFELHSVAGVYQIQDGSMVPMRPGILSGGSGSYELEESIDSSGVKRDWLNLHFPEAFEEPRTITIDARWLQPWFSEALQERLAPATYGRNIVGLEWELVGNIVPHAENTLQAEMEGFLHLLTMRSKSAFNVDDLRGMLQTLGSVPQGKFKRAYDLLADVRVEETPLSKGGTAGLLTLVYYLRFRDFDLSLMPLVEMFVTHVEYVLDSWISEAIVRVRMEGTGAAEQSLQAGGRV
jgi:type VI secretion system protein ImpG